MIVSVHQPSYWPWLGLLDKIAKSETFVMLDSVQHSPRSYQARNIFLAYDRPKFLTLPTIKSERPRISELKFRDEDWREEHLAKLTAYYRRAPHFSSVFSEVQELYRMDTPLVVDVLLATLRFALNFLGIRTGVVSASELSARSAKGELMLELCEAVGATTYLSGQGAREYMMETLPAFDRAQINVEWQSFKHPTYLQLPGVPFVQGLACLDLFFFLGKTGARELFWQNVERTKGGPEA